MAQQGLTRDYEAFYADGGWKYDRDREFQFLKDRIIDPLGLQPGQKLLDFGCGMGLFAGLFHEHGFEVTAVDLSPEGIANGKANFPDVAYHNMDGNGVFDLVAPESLDVIFVRGMSWYHYELNSVNKHGVDVPAKTRALFGLLKPGGHFILQIKTDFTGTRPAEGVYLLEVDEFVRHFEPLGDIRLVTDWAGTPLKTNEDGRASGKKIIIATQKP